MCIVCNVPDTDLAFSYLDANDTALMAMRHAADKMLACSRAAATPESRRAYDMAHKAMRRLIRYWNRLEQQREVEGTVFVECAEKYSPATPDTSPQKEDH